MIYTTIYQIAVPALGCLCAVKLQFLNDIHNTSNSHLISITLSLRGKVTIFEWYTQRNTCTWLLSFCCLCAVKLQFLNDIHNPMHLLIFSVQLSLRGKVTIFEWYTQLTRISVQSSSCCLCAVKLQFLNDIHNCISWFFLTIFVVFAR